LGGHFSDGIDIYGLVDGGRTESLSIYSSSEIYVTQLGFGSGIDELQIVGASQGDRELLLDNFVLGDFDAPVPEPATMTLLGMGLASLGYRARRKPAKLESSS